ncbi:hypothetical protein IQ06DRAFT_331099 [Phaeosphaeriaceae sp. SRC1lsM3a]|nr:hypothetical protein IQ06DRAFT_331099 [Stagonospora sp. SRC1lsM3a]
MSTFRLEDVTKSDASDSDQSTQSERSLSPSTAGTRKSRQKKKKERRQVAALTDDLGILLGAAFKTDPGLSTSTKPAIGGFDEESTGLEMDVEATSSTKGPSKRTRQNLAKMEKRKLAREQQQQDKLRRQMATSGTQDQVMVESQRQQKNSKKDTTKARRQRKQKERARKTIGQGDAMELE